MTSPDRGEGVIGPFPESHAPVTDDSPSARYPGDMATADLFPPGIRPYTDREEVLHALTHGAAVPVAALAAVALLTRAEGGAQVTAAAIYGASMVALYLASTLYHATWRTDRQGLFRTIDHAAIYVKIAGTYTPMTLIALPPGPGISLLSAIWLLAAAGIATKLARHGRPADIVGERLSLACYLAMGWVGVLAIGPIFTALGPAGFAWLMAGAGCFTVGAAIYAQQRWQYNHLAWHLFVLAGSACHFVMVWRVIGA